MARILNLSERTLHRLRPEALLDNNASERLLLLEELTTARLRGFRWTGRCIRQMAADTFIRTPGTSPLTLLDTATGFGMVHTVLGRIEHGIYA